MLKHVLKNALIPVVTLLGPMFAAVGTGSFFVESIFRVPGMGRFFVLSMTGRDYPMIMAVVLIYGGFLAVMNLRRRPPLWHSRPPHPVLASPRPRGSRCRREPAKGTSLWRDAWRRLLRNKLAVAGGITVILLCLVAIFADYLAPYSYTKPNFGRLYEYPTRDYPLGTDQLGRDVLSRMIYGARVSMLVGLGAQVIVVLIGVPIGLVSGYLGGRVDLVLTRFVDVMYAFPRLLFVILIMSMLGAGLMNIFIAIGLTGWVGIARQTRAQVLSIKEKEFVEGARALGAGFWRIMTRHVLPERAHAHRGVGVASASRRRSSPRPLCPSSAWASTRPRRPGARWSARTSSTCARTGISACSRRSPSPSPCSSFTFFGDGVRDALDPKMK